MIELYTDHYFHIGSMHLTNGKPCQDYAISGRYDDIAMAIVSDGCSTGRHTDVGSRILALSTATAIREHWIINRSALGANVFEEVNFRQNIVSTGTRQIIGLAPQDMLATSMYAYISPSGGFIHVQGDGVIVLKYRDGGIEMHRFEWTKNLPYYPAYKENGLSDFIKAHGNDLNALELSQESAIREIDGGLLPSGTSYHTLGDGIKGVTINVPEETLSRVEFIALFSDGIAQIDGIDWKEAVSLFTAFKNIAGEFAKRRMIRGIKDVQKIGKGPIDDISYAVIRVEKIEDKEVPRE